MREAAVADELNVSAWLADAARRQLTSRGLHDVIDASIAIIAPARSRHGHVAIVTSNPDDLNQLINVLNAPVRIAAI